MKRVCGFALLNISVGMVAGFCLPDTSVFEVIFCLICLAGGYMLFCK